MLSTHPFHFQTLASSSPFNGTGYNEGVTPELFQTLPSGHASNRIMSIKTKKWSTKVLFKLINKGTSRSTTSRFMLSHKS
jgi:hypothetical protein